MSERVEIRYKKGGKVKAVKPKEAKTLVKLGKAEYVDKPVKAAKEPKDNGTYTLKEGEEVLQAPAADNVEDAEGGSAPKPKRRGRPPKAKVEDSE